jgi:hypothetical protein
MIGLQNDMTEIVTPGPLDAGQLDSVSKLDYRRPVQAARALWRYPMLNHERRM